MSDIKLSIDGIKDHVESIVEANVARALAGGDNVLERIIGKFCAEETKRHDTSMTRVQSMIYEVIEAHVRKVVWEIVDEGKDEFKAEIRRQIREKHATLIKKMATATLSIPDDNWEGEIKIKVKIER